MTEYELNCARQAFERALEVGAPGLSEVIRRAILNNATTKLRHQLNVPAKPLNIRIEDTSLALAQKSRARF
jgi:hypothetical protein